MLGEMIGPSHSHISGLMRKLKRMEFVEYNQTLKIHPTPLLFVAQFPFLARLRSDTGGSPLPTRW